VVSDEPIEGRCNARTGENDDGPDGFRPGELDSGLAWLRRAADLLTLTGDQCAWPSGSDGGDRTLHDG